MSGMIGNWMYAQHELRRQNSAEARKKNMYTMDGRALLLVQEIMRIQHHCGCTPIARDTMFDMARKLLLFQERLLMLGGKPIATIAFHYTNSSNLASIGENGLFSGRERTAASVRSHSKHGSVYGDGIYVGNNPHIFSRYGDTCVVCIVIRGNERDHPKIHRGGARSAGWGNSILQTSSVQHRHDSHVAIPMLVGISPRLRAELDGESAMCRRLSLHQQQCFSRAGILFYRRNRSRGNVEVLLGQLVLNSSQGRGEWTLIDSTGNARASSNTKPETPKDVVCRRFREVMGASMSMYGLRRQLDTAEALWNVYTRQILFLVEVPRITLDDAHKYLMSDTAGAHVHARDGSCS